MKLYDLFDRADYTETLSAGYIRENHHPYLDLRILNYTEKAQFDNVWNNVTKQCRGLIVNSENTVIARPFDKFMNYGQNPSDKMLMDQRVVATDKMDGSLGILWSYQGEQGIATRGSFISDQAWHATKLWKKKYNFAVAPEWTYMFEIIYPDNRIVLNYGDMDDLVLLGVRDIEDGSVLAPNEVVTWHGPKTPTFPYKTLREALEAPQRPNAEGLVLYFPDLDYRIKLKQDDYVALHKIVTGLTKRRIWESMKEGKSLEELCEIVPDEWHEWLQSTYWDIDTNLRSLRSISEDYFIYLRHSTLNAAAEGREWTRKDFALVVKNHPHKDMLFLLLDGKSKEFRDKSFDLVKPSAE